MDRDYLNKKWLVGELTKEEQKAFEQIEDNELLKKIIDTAPAFSATNFYKPKDFQTLKGQMQTKKRSWLAPMLKIASIFVIAFGIYFLFFFTNTITIETNIGEKVTVELPDASEVMLNAVSEIVYNDKTWTEKRELTLDGEAFFKVAKGSTFDVITSTGKVSVLGTKFNVKNRKNFFEVKCFEGQVAFTYKKDTWKLLPGDVYRIINGKLINEVIKNDENPYWIDDTSYFKKVPFNEVVEELERQYNVTITVNVNDKDLLFTGGFVHNNLKEALKSITIPLNLDYIMETPTKISLRYSD